jgi:hypothetical protein
MRSRTLLIVIGLLALSFGLGVYTGMAGAPEPPGPPASTSSYTLEDIYSRLNAGAAGSQQSFTEPATGPGTGTMHSLDDIMAVAPAADDTNGAVPGDVLSGKTYWGLRADGMWGTQTGAAPPALVPKTGQTECYTTTTNSETPCPAVGYPGQDGYYQKGVAWPEPRFVTITTGVVSDTLTGLVWLQNANCISSTYPGFDIDGAPGDGRVDWQSALDFVAGMTVTGSYSNCAAGFSDWRLPNVRELHSLIDFSQDSPALPSGHPFTGVQLGNYWSSTTHADNTSWAWAVVLYDGFVSFADKALTFYVWPVRGGQ